jgi:hypothetical protein
MRSTADFIRPAPTLVALTIGFVGIFVACSSDPAASSSSSSSSSGASGNDSPAITAAECTNRCKTKLDACGAPAAQTEQGCTQVCSNSVTEAQAACFEAKDCEQLAAVETIDEICPRSSGGSSGSSGSSGTSGGLPTELTIKGNFGDVEPFRGTQDGKVVSTLSVAPKPKFSPSQPSSLPKISASGVTVTVTSPDPGNCKPDMSFTLNTNEIGVNIVGADTPPATDCVAFVNSVASNGFKATFKDVPYPNSSTKATVNVDLSP